MQKHLVILTLLSTLFLASCALDLEGIAKANSVISEYMEANPNAEVLMVHLTTEQVQAQFEELQDTCGGVLTLKEYYRVTVEDETANFKITAYLDPEEGRIDCLLRVPLEKVEVEKDFEEEKEEKAPVPSSKDSDKKEKEDKEESEKQDSEKDEKDFDDVDKDKIEEVAYFKVMLEDHILKEENDLELDRNEEHTLTIYLEGFAKDLHIVGKIIGSKVVERESETFDLDGEKKIRLDIEFPGGSEEYEVEVEIFQGDSVLDQRDFDIYLKEEIISEVAITEVEFEEEAVEAGQGILSAVTVKNEGNQDEENVKVWIEVPKLGVMGYEYVDVLEAGEKATVEVEFETPDCVEEKEYVILVKLFLDGDFVEEEDFEIFIEEGSSCGKEEGEASISFAEFDPQGPYLAGEEIQVLMKVENDGPTLEDVKFSAAITPLGIFVYDYVDDISESYTHDSLTISLPECMDEGEYLVEMEVYHSQGELYKTEEIFVEGSTC